MPSVTRRFRHALVLRLVSAQLSFGVIGCAPAISQFDSEPVSKWTTATITVDNRHLGDVTVYAVIGDARYRLGTVETARTRTFKIPSAIQLPSEVGVYVRAMADAEDFSANPILLGPGGSLQLTVEYATAFSTLLRR